MVDIWCDLSRASIAQEPCEGTLTTTNCSILEHKSTLKRVWLTSASTVLLPKSAQTGPAEFNDRISCYDFTALSLNQIQLCFGNVSCAGLCFINRSIQWILAVTTRLLGGGEPEIIHPDGKGPGGFAGSKQWEGSTSLHAVRRCRSTAVPAEALVTLQGICRELWDVPVCSQDWGCGKYRAGRYTGEQDAALSALQTVQGPCQPDPACVWGAPELAVSFPCQQLVQGQLSCPWQCCSLQCRHTLSPALTLSNHHLSQNKIVP